MTPIAALILGLAIAPSIEVTSFRGEYEVRIEVEVPLDLGTVWGLLTGYDTLSRALVDGLVTEAGRR